MKIARVFLLAALLLSAFSQTAFASQQAVGFVQLVSRADPNTPMAVQTHQALRRLMPRLLAARDSGQIISFEPSPEAGILKIVYRPSAGLPDLGGKTVYADMQQALPTAPAADLAPSLGACTAPNFAMTLYGSYFVANCLTPAAKVIGSLRDAGGSVVAAYSGVVDGTGALYYPHFSWNGPYANVTPGYTLTFKEYAGATLLATFKIKVPNIRFTSLDKANSIVQGTGPAGKSISLEWIHYKWDATDSRIDLTKVRTISSAGTWKVDFGTTPIRGDDFLFAVVTSNANFTFSANMWTPATYCTLGGNYCELYGFPFGAASMKIVHGGMTYNFSGKFDEWGTFYVELKTAIGTPISLVPYDKVSGTGVAQYGLPKVTASINYTTDSVTGIAPTNKYFEVWLYPEGTGSSYEIYAHSGATGGYSANFMASDGLNLVAGNPYTVDVFYMLPTTGNCLDAYKVYGP